MNKRQLRFTSLLLFSPVFFAFSPVLHAATTIDAVDKYAYGANIGWIDWRGDISHGAVIGDTVCYGYIYSANVGWINLGSGSPANGVRYQNLSANDFGVNQDGLGNLRGYAYGANIGWINFETNGAPSVDLATGKLSGYIYSANCGWISLSNAFAFVQTDSIAVGTLPPPVYNVVDLLTLGGTGPVGYSGSEAYDLNNFGQMVGYSYTAGDANWQTALWTNIDSSPLDLGTLGGDFSEAWAISDAGQIVGDAYLSDGTFHAAIWSNLSPGAQDLGGLGGNSSAQGVNNSGQFAGFSYIAGNANYHAVFWPDRNSPPRDLGTLGGPNSAALWINASGQMVGSANPAGSGMIHATFWATGGSAAVDLGTLGNPQSEALAINNAGQIVGSASTEGFFDQARALFWTNSSSNPVSLETPGADNSEAVDINGPGQIVGLAWTGSFASNPPTRAVIWINGGSPAVDLNTLIPADSGWVLQYTNAINDSGEIVGVGTFRGQTRGFALIPLATGPRITSAARSGNDLWLTFTSQAGHNYNVLSTTDLAASNWSNLQTGIPGNGGTVQVIIPHTFDQPNQFFIIQQAP